MKKVLALLLGVTLLIGLVGTRQRSGQNRHQPMDIHR